MKKKILFVIPSLDAGGAEKSLINLLNSIDYSLYEIDLVLLHKKGVFLPMIPKEINLISLESNYLIFTNGLIPSIISFIHKWRLDLVVNRILFFFKNKFLKNKAIAEQNAWSNIKMSLAVLDKHYDVAIGYLEKSSIYFVVDKVEATKKIGFIHNDYQKLELDANLDAPYFRKLKYIVTVSEECSLVLEKNFPLEKDKVKIIYNIVSSSLINKLSEEVIDTKFSPPILLTIARFHIQKGLDLAIDAAKILKDKSISFKWLVIGDGALREVLEKKIKLNSLENHFVLIGIKENPYPYLKKAAIYVQPSRYEGKSIAIDEAKILKKPIVVTNFTTAKDQIVNNYNGIIAEIDSKSIAIAIENLLSDVALQEKLTLNLATQNFGTESEINKLYQLIND